MAEQIKHNRGRCADGSPNPVDTHVGTRLRLRRTLLGMSQQALGDLLQISFQQVQKYERGTNRVGASRLYDLSRALAVPVSFFFDGIEDDDGKPRGQTIETLNDRKTLELVRNFSVLDVKGQQLVSNLAKGLADDRNDAEQGDAA